MMSYDMISCVMQSYDTITIAMYIEIQFWHTAYEASKKTKQWRCCEFREGKNHNEEGNRIKKMELKYMI